MHPSSLLLNPTHIEHGLTHSVNLRVRICTAAASSSLVRGKVANIALQILERGAVHPSSLLLNPTHIEHGLTHSVNLRVRNIAAGLAERDNTFEKRKRLACRKFSSVLFASHLFCRTFLHPNRRFGISLNV